MNDVDLEISAAFVEEGLEMIDEVEPQLVALETTQDAAGHVDLEMVNSIFRLFHSLKGSAGFLELTNIVELTHKAENLLDIFRKGEAALAGPDIPLLLQTIDLLRKVMEDLAESGRDDAYRDEVQAQVAALQVSITAKQNGEPAPAAPAAAPEPAAEPEVAVDWPDPAADAPDALHFPAITVTPEMKARFIEEAEELLDAAEQDLLAALKAGPDGPDLAEALRALHSFKGNAGFMGFRDLEELTHRIETVLEEVVAGTIATTDQTLAVFLEVVDADRRAVASLSDGGTGRIDGLADLLARLDALQGGDAAPTDAPPAAPKKSGFIPLGRMPAAKAPARSEERH
ncbi:Hpt domain-containing protein, partial [bacterium]|nr:Hpt domain-containing protein [bacterium]